MKKALILKLEESVNDSNLRYLNELRFKIFPQGDMSEGMGIGRISESTVDVEIEFISGDGYFMDRTDMTNLGRKTTYSNDGNKANLKIYCTEECEISIKNYDIVGDLLGLVNIVSFFISTENSPIGVIDMKELKYKYWIKNISGAWLKGNIKELSNLNSLEEIKITPPAQIQPYSLNDIADIKDANPALTHINLEYLPNILGDVYNYFIRSEKIVNEDFRRSTNLDRNISCSYISGVSEIPQLEIGIFHTFRAGDFENNDILSFLNMLKDGINSGKITLLDNLVISASVKNKSFLTDPSFTSLYDEVKALFNDKLDII